MKIFYVLGGGIYWIKCTSSVVCAIAVNYKILFPIEFCNLYSKVTGNRRGISILWICLLGIILITAYWSGIFAVILNMVKNWPVTEMAENRCWRCQSTGGSDHKELVVEMTMKWWWKWRNSVGGDGEDPPVNMVFHLDFFQEDAMQGTVKQ